MIISTLTRYLWGIFIALIFTNPTSIFCEDWPQHGRTIYRNMVSGEKGLPETIDLGTPEAPGASVRWKASFDGIVYGVAIVANGKVYITAAAKKDNPKYPYLPGKKLGALYCFNEKTGDPAWTFGAHSKAQFTRGQFGMTCAPTIEGERLYTFGGRLFVFCLTTNGIGGGNVGPIQNEESLYKIRSPYKLEDTDADMIWMFDNEKQFPTIDYHNAYAYSPLVDGDYIYASTGNGAVKDFQYLDEPQSYPNEDTPTFMILDKRTGKLIAHDEELMGRGMIHGSWGTPCVGIVNGKKQILYGGCDGVVYSFEPEPELREGKPGVLKKIWSFDPNVWLDTYRRYEVFGAPVCVDNRVYAAVSDDWTHPKDPGILVCIDATQQGDITKSGLVWQYKDIGLFNGTVAISNGLLYAADLNGRIHCLDKDTGKPYWVLQTQGNIRVNPVVADGKVFIGNHKGEFFILRESKVLEVLERIYFPGEINGSVTIANRTLYIPSGNTLYAIRKP